MNELTQSYLKQRVAYDPLTGIFTRLKGSKRWPKGEICGRLRYNGYRGIHIDGKSYAAHRLAVLYMTGHMPAYQVDHIDGVRDNNRWANLREATNAENHQNMKLMRRNSSGVCGVSWDKREQRWVAQIHVHGKHYYLGQFVSFEDAVAARMTANIGFGFSDGHGTVRQTYSHEASSGK